MMSLSKRNSLLALSVALVCLTIFLVGLSRSPVETAVAASGNAAVAASGNADEKIRSDFDVSNHVGEMPREADMFAQSAKEVSPIYAKNHNADPDIVGEIPSNILDISNLDIREFDRKINPSNAGLKVFMHKLLLQERDDVWASETEAVLWRLQEEFFAELNAISKTEYKALEVDCRKDICYVDMPLSEYKKADSIRHDKNGLEFRHIIALVGGDGEPFAHQLAFNGISTRGYKSENIARWVLAFNRESDPAMVDGKDGG